MYFVDGLKKAASASHALAHYQQNPRWFTVRDKLEILIVAGQELATSKAMPRHQVLQEINEMAKNLPKDVNGN